MGNKTISVRYYGSRFPRTVSLRGGQKISFLQNRLVLDLEEYDALLLLRANTRMNPEKFEFSIERVEDSESNVEDSDKVNDANEELELEVGMDIAFKSKKGKEQVGEIIDLLENEAVIKVGKDTVTVEFERLYLPKN